MKNSLHTRRLDVPIVAAHRAYDESNQAGFDTDTIFNPAGAGAT